MATDYRKIHKEKLKAILQSIEFEGSNLEVHTKYVTSGNTDPYIFITSGGLDAGEIRDSRTYMWSYYYNITIAFIIDDETLNDLSMPNAVGYPDQDILQDPRVDDLEALILDKLSNNDLKEIPEEIASLENLEVLHLHNNPISSVPNSIKNLKHLKQLMVHKKSRKKTEEDESFIPFGNLFS